MNGTTGPSSHIFWLHSAPGAVQIPQLELQHTWPTLQVLAPHGALLGIEAKPQSCREHASPGAAQSPHVGLQQTSPGAHMVEGPHGTGGSCGGELGTGW